MTLSVIILGTTGFSMSVSSAEAAADSLPSAMLACASEQDVMARLSCYDREVAVLVASPPTPATPPLVVVSPSAAPQSNRVSDLADTSAPVVATSVPQVIVANSPAPKPAAAEAAGFGYERELETLSATVVQIRKRPYGEMIILLDNGQTWEQKHVDRRFKLSVGDTVTIKKGKVAGYRLSGSGNKTIQVSRLK